MANWSSTDYVITGPEQYIRRIHKAIQDVESGAFIGNPKASKMWEGNVLLALGIPASSDIEGVYFPHLRGFIQYSELNGNETLIFYAEEAWTRTCFAEMLRLYMPDIRVYWKSEEPGCGYYVTNDSQGNYFNERVYIDGLSQKTIDGHTVAEYHNEYFSSVEDAWEYADRNFGIRCADDINKFNEEDSSGYFYMNFFDVCGIDDFIYDVSAFKPKYDTNLF